MVYIGLLSVNVVVWLKETGHKVWTNHPGVPRLPHLL